MGRIEKMERHPDSDHMWVCQLDVGKEEPVQIVTGAWEHPMWATWSLWPSTSPPLPGGKKIEKGKLRGVLSNGMLCSLSELGLDERDFPYGVITAAAPPERLPPPSTRTSPPSRRKSNWATRSSALWWPPGRVK